MPGRTVSARRRSFRPRLLPSSGLPALPLACLLPPLQRLMMEPGALQLSQQTLLLVLGCVGASIRHAGRELPGGLPSLLGEQE